MRNWNLIQIKEGGTRQNCFYSTYEELKHGKKKKFVKGGRVFTVPMRNWNFQYVFLILLS